MDTTGTITSFSATPRSDILIGGDSYEVETAGRSYSLTNPDQQTLRFEIQPGDHAWFDSGSVDRSEIEDLQRIPTATPVNINYQFMVEPNGPNGSFINTASWFVVGEMHNDDAVSGVHTSPPFAIQLDGDHLQVVARYCPTGLDPSNSAGNLTMLTLWTDPNPIQPGQYNNIQIQANVSNTSSGYLDVWVNGTQVVNYNGPLGYGTQTYWEEGLYRNSGPSETVAADFRNLTLTTGSAATSSTSGTSSSGTSSSGTTSGSTSGTTSTTSGGTSSTDTSSSGTTSGSTSGTTSTTSGGTSSTDTSSSGTTSGSTSGTTSTTSGGTSSTDTSSSGTTSGSTSGTTSTGTTSSDSTSGSTTTSATPIAPTLTIANHSLSVSPGSPISLGIGVSVPNAGDNVSVTISGLPKYETITDNLDNKISSGKSVTLTAAEVNSGLSLSSSYHGHGHPTATLTVTATDATGTAMTSAAQTITVNDPPTTTTSSGTSTTTSGGGKSWGQSQNWSNHDHVVAAADSGTLATTARGSASTARSHSHRIDVTQSFNHHPDFAPAVTTLSEAGASRSGAVPQPHLAAATSDATASACAKAYALLNQMMAADVGEAHFGHAVTTLSALSQQQSPSLSRPLH